MDLLDFYIAPSIEGGTKVQHRMESLSDGDLALLIRPAATAMARCLVIRTHEKSVKEERKEKEKWRLSQHGQQREEEEEKE